MKTVKSLEFLELKFSIKFLLVFQNVSLNLKIGKLLPQIIAKTINPMRPHHNPTDLFTNFFYSFMLYTLFLSL